MILSALGDRIPRPPRLTHPSTVGTTVTVCDLGVLGTLSTVAVLAGRCLPARRCRCVHSEPTAVDRRSAVETVMVSPL